MNVCDSGTYILYNAQEKEVARISRNYVPNDLIPGEYGDYIDLKINKEGFITNWPKGPDVSEFFKIDEDD